MEEEKIKFEDWTIIMEHFDIETNSRAVKSPNSVGDFILEEAKKKCGENLDLLGKFFKKTDRRMDDCLNDTIFLITDVAFSFGFVFGQMFNICTEEGQKAVENLKGKILRAGILLYCPKVAPNCPGQSPGMPTESV